MITEISANFHASGGHMIQKNYKYDPVDCDNCQVTMNLMIISGGGHRECLHCHLRECKRCEFSTNRVIKEDVFN